MPSTNIPYFLILGQSTRLGYVKLRLSRTVVGLSAWYYRSFAHDVTSNHRAPILVDFDWYVWYTVETRNGQIHMHTDTFLYLSFSGRSNFS